MKKPLDRGAFDNTVVGELDRCFSVKIAELASMLAAGKPESEARATAVAQASASLEQAEAMQEGNF
jgi:hypothetical protein